MFACKSWVSLPVLWKLPMIIHQFLAITQNVTEQYFSMTKSKQSLTGLRHFELNGTARVVRSYSSKISLDFTISLFTSFLRADVQISHLNKGPWRAPSNSSFESLSALYWKKMGWKKGCLLLLNKAVHLPEYTLFLKLKENPPDSWIIDIYH